MRYSSCVCPTPSSWPSYPGTVPVDVRDYFIYTGQEGEGVPEDVIRVAIDSSVRAIKDGAFSWCTELVIVNLSDGLEEIGFSAFYNCTTPHEIVIPNAIKTIKEDAFRCCFDLTTVILGDGLEEIRAFAFNSCRSLHEIVIPNAVKTVKDGAFSYCSGLTSITLSDGMEDIGEELFWYSPTP